MEKRLLVRRRLPDGTETTVRPFHVSLEGLESAIICQDEEDYDAVVKYICLSALRANVIIIIYAVVSNHGHIGILAESLRDAKRFDIEVKRVISMWNKKKYGLEHILRDSDTSITEIETVQYARNALAYIPRNALDNGVSNVGEYKWTGFRGMFCKGKVGSGWRSVRSLKKRERERIMHTSMSLTGIDWLMNEDNEIEPISVCDHEYLENIFNNDQTFFLRLIGGINSTEMTYSLSGKTKVTNTDGEFMRIAKECSLSWFNCDVQSLGITEKAKLIHYLKKKWRMTVPQTARCLGLERQLVAKLLGREYADCSRK